MKTLIITVVSLIVSTTLSSQTNFSTPQTRDTLVQDAYLDLEPNFVFYFKQGFWFQSPTIKSEIIVHVINYAGNHLIKIVDYRDSNTYRYNEVIEGLENTDKYVILTDGVISVGPNNCSEVLSVNLLELMDDISQILE